MSAHSESSVFQALFRAAWKEYEDRTGTSLNEHPLAIQLQTCHSFESLLALLQEQARTFHEFRGGDHKVMFRSIICACPCDIHVCQDVTNGGGSFDALVNLFESIKIFLYRLDIYVKIPPTVAMTEIVVKIMVELLSTLALAANQMGQGRLGEPLLADLSLSLAERGAEKIEQKFLGGNEVDAVLQRVDRLTQDETRTTAAQTFQVVYGLAQDMRVVMNGEQFSLCLSLKVS
jgi:hypothetical protein